MERLQRFFRDGLTFDVRDAGPLGGETVLLLHGFPQDSTAWDDVVPALHDAGLRTLAPDQRGYSPGARPAGRRSYRVAELVADAVALLDAAGVQRAHLVGHDWGGAVAWTLAGRHPDRVISMTALSTPHPQAYARAARRAPQAARSWYMAAFQLPWLPERTLPRLLARQLPATGLPAVAAERYARVFRDPAALAGALAWYRALPYDALPFTPRESHPPVLVPSTYIWGRRDPFFSRAAVEGTRSYVSAPYRFVELDAGHWLPEERPVPVATVLLDQVRAVAQA